MTFAACERWVAAAFLHRRGLPYDQPPCSCPPDTCPPLTAPTPKEQDR